MNRFTPHTPSSLGKTRESGNTRSPQISPLSRERLGAGINSFFKQITKIFETLRVIKQEISSGVYSRFVTELFLLFIAVAAIATNFSYRTSSTVPVAASQSLLFSFLKQNPEANPKLVDAFESVNLKLENTHTFTKQILAASKKGEIENVAPLPTLSGSALLKPNPAGSSAAGIKKDIEVYQVKNGDTVGRIAATYGVTVDTIVWENNLTSAGLIKPGQELKILPTSGIKHIVQIGETISGIAKKYGVDAEDILEFNEIEIVEHIFPGEEIIIPNGIKKSPPTPQRQQYLADLQKEDYKKVEVPSDFQGSSAGYVWPLPAARRLSQYFSSKHRAIDVPCRDCSVVAAAAGIVELAGWQTGYGNTIVVNHGNGVKTRYAHGKQLLVSAGDNVEQGQQVMISGSTGRSTGPHLHFEVKVNGQLVNPLGVVGK